MYRKGVCQNFVDCSLAKSNKIQEKPEEKASFLCDECGLELKLELSEKRISLPTWINKRSLAMTLLILIGAFAIWRVVGFESEKCQSQIKKYFVRVPQVHDKKLMDKDGGYLSKWLHKDTLNKNIDQKSFYIMRNEVSHDLFLEYANLLDLGSEEEKQLSDKWRKKQENEVLGFISFPVAESFAQWFSAKKLDYCDAAAIKVNLPTELQWLATVYQYFDLNNENLGGDEATKEVSNLLFGQAEWLRGSCDHLDDRKSTRYSRSIYSGSHDRGYASSALSSVHCIDKSSSEAHIGFRLVVEGALGVEK